jgi:uracil-DNA glycosylase family 4
VPAKKNAPAAPNTRDSFRVLNEEIISCTRCARLIDHCTTVARVKRRAYLDKTYWGKPVPAFGDPRARLLIVGLAPGAHGSNRTGRMFTGDRSGEFLFRALYETGFASQPESHANDDGLQLTDAFITAAARCAPPGNKPTPEEFRNCSIYLERELALLRNVQVVVALGKLGFDAYIKALGVPRAPYIFGHDRGYKIGAITLISCYHPSQQNTSTGKLTFEMLRDVFEHAKVRLK